LKGGKTSRTCTNAGPWGGRVSSTQQSGGFGEKNDPILSAGVAGNRRYKAVHALEGKEKRGKKAFETLDAVKAG